MKLARSFRPITVGAAGLLALALMTAPSYAQPPSMPKMSPATTPGGAPYHKIFEGMTKVVSTTDGKPPLFELWVDKVNHRILAQLPQSYDKKKFFFAMTVAAGEKYAGLQAGDRYIIWKKIGDRLALIEPNLDVRSTGDAESKSSVNRLFTGKVLVDVPILATSPKNEPIIDMDDLLVRNSGKFFGMGRSLGGGFGGGDPGATFRLRQIEKAKSFPENVEIAYRVPMGGGQLKVLHYSISDIPDNTGYRPRKADDRVGYFTTSYSDLGKYKEGQVKTRFINRWHIEKADPSLKLSPPKRPIVFYIEHTTPIRYRRFIKDGTLYWNKAFERVGIVNAIEVYYQDAATGAHMEKDPEDVRYNFIRWLNNDVGTAIGPSRVHPLTGEILDADIILTDGWIRHFEKHFAEILPKLAMDGFSPETLTWLERHPRWDPRFLMAQPAERNLFLQSLARKGFQPLGGHPLAAPQGVLMGTSEYDGLGGRVSQMNGMCLASWGKAIDLTILRMTLDMMEMELQKKDDKAKDAKPQPKADDDDNLDGIPAKFVGPLLADLVAHEVGHTLGLRHNFKASGLYSLKDINSKKIKGVKPFTASVMDYIPINIDMKDGEMQGDFAMINIGPYDEWAIEYGYTFDEKNLDKILARSVEPELAYGTDQDTVGPDPLARRYDFSSNPLDYAKSQMRLAKYHRERLIDKFVKDGESWAKARKGYELTLAMQVRSQSMMANWIGGAFIHRDHKGSKGNRPPIEPVPAATQRDALRWLIETTFRDESFGLTPKILERIKGDHLMSDESMFRMQEQTFPIHDRIMGIQSSVLTMLMNPTTLRRVYDNELTLDSSKDALTLPEMLNTVEGEIWTELQTKPNGKYSNRHPMISSLRRNLQREYIERLIDLMNPEGGNPAASRPISTLSMLHLRELNQKLDTALNAFAGKMDEYTQAHLRDAKIRITKALDAQYIINPRDQSTGPMRLFFGADQNGICPNPNCRFCNPATAPAPTGSWDNRP
jgi:hypothetical protein